MSGGAPGQANGRSVQGETQQGQWTEERLQESLDHLDLLHTKARLLRDTIPKLIDPLIQKQQSPDMLFNAFIGAVSEARGDISEFAQLMNQTESKAIFERAEKSRQETPTGIKPWRHKDHPEWFKANGLL